MGQEESRIAQEEIPIAQEEILVGLGANLVGQEEPNRSHSRPLVRPWCVHRSFRHGNHHHLGARR